MVNEFQAHKTGTSQTGNKGTGDEQAREQRFDTGLSNTQPAPATDTAGTADAGDMNAAADSAMNMEDSGDTAVADDVETLQAQLQAAQQAADDNRNQLMRLQAEMDNLRKRTVRDVESAHKFALEKFADELLPVIDSLELGINAADSSGDAEGLRQGMELTLQKFLDVVGKFGVEPINPLGEKFNPELHEAVSMQESEEAESGTVITVMQKGYTLNRRLIRPAMVVVAK